MTVMRIDSETLAFLKQGARDAFSFLRNSRKGQTAWILGNGPTLFRDFIRMQADHPMEMEKGVVIQVNRGPQIFEKMGIRFWSGLSFGHFWICADTRPFWCATDWVVEKKAQGMSYLPRILCSIGATVGRPMLLELGNEVIPYEQPTPNGAVSLEMVRAWCADGKLPIKGTVIEPAMALAAWMGVKRIVLLGVNCGFEKPDEVRAGGGEDQWYASHEPERYKNIVEERVRAETPEGKTIYSHHSHSFMATRLNALRTAYEVEIELFNASEWSQLNWNKYR